MPTSTPCEDDEWDSIDLTESQVKCLHKLEESADSSMEPVVKKNQYLVMTFSSLENLLKGLMMVQEY